MLAIMSMAPPPSPARPPRTRPPMSEPCLRGAVHAGADLARTPGAFDSSQQIVAGPLVDFQFAGVDALGVIAGTGQQQPVERAARFQLGGRTDVDQATVVEDRDPVGQLQRGAPVRDQQRGPVRP